MSQDVVEKVLGRLLTDDAFLRRAARELAAACWEAGYRLGEDELQLLATVDLDTLSRVAEGLHGRLRRFSLPPAGPSSATGPSSSPPAGRTRDGPD